MRVKATFHDLLCAMESASEASELTKSEHISGQLLSEVLVNDMKTSIDVLCAVLLLRIASTVYQIAGCNIEDSDDPASLQFESDYIEP